MRERYLLYGSGFLWSHYQSLRTIKRRRVRVKEDEGSGPPGGGERTPRSRQGRVEGDGGIVVTEAIVFVTISFRVTHGRFCWPGEA